MTLIRCHQDSLYLAYVFLLRTDNQEGHLRLLYIGDWSTPSKNPTQPTVKGPQFSCLVVQVGHSEEQKPPSAKCLRQRFGDGNSYPSAGYLHPKPCLASEHWRGKQNSRNSLKFEGVQLVRTHGSLK